MKKKRILYITSGKNGIHGFTKRELELLVEKEINPFICLTQLKKESFVKWDYYVFRYLDIVKSFIIIFTRFLSNGFMTEAIRNNELKSLFIALCFYNKTKDLSPEGIHVQMGDHKLLMGFYLSRMHKVPLSTTLHAHELYFEQHENKFKRYSSVLKQCRKIFTVSEFNKRIIHDEFNIELESIELMHLYPSINPKINEQTIKLLVVGNWEKKKGYCELIQAIELLKDKNIIVYVAGSKVNPKVDLDLPFLARKHGVEDKFVFLGKLNQEILEILYRFCDIFVLPSKTEYYYSSRIKEREGIPVALMEAIFFGLPVITTYHAGIPELVDSVLIPEEDIKSLTAAIDNAIINISKLKAQAEINRSNLLRNFSDKNINVLSDYFHNLARI